MTDTATAKRTLLKNSSRVNEIVRTLGKYGFASWAVGAPEEYENVLEHLSTPELLDMSDGERVRMICLDLGTTFIKIGQLLSTRADLVGKDVADALASLQGDVPPDPPDVVRRTIETELGRPVDEVFASFDDKPLGSASIAQVHAATLDDGTEVVLKVQHPGIRELIEEDLDILEALAVLAVDKDTDLALYRPVEVAGQLRRSLLAETDFTREANNLSRFRENFADEQDIVIPEPHMDYTTKSVLTMSHVDGVPLSSVIDEMGPNGETFVRRGADVYVEMIFRDGLFHADPHPGNIYVIDDATKVGLLDFGKVGRVDEDVQDMIDDIVVSALSHDPDAMTGAVIAMCDPPPDLDRSALQRDLTDWMDRYASGNLGDTDIGGALDAGDELLRRHRLVIPPDVALLGRTLAELQGMLAETGYDVSIGEVLRPYASMIASKRFAPKRMLRHARRTAKEWEHLADTFPDDVSAILQGVRSGQIDVPLTIDGLDRNVNRLVYAALAAALFTGSARLWSTRVPPRVGDMSIPGAIGTISAGVFAFRLLRSARRVGGIG